MDVKTRLEKLEKTQRQKEVILTVIYSDGSRGPSYVVGKDGLKPKESEAQNDSRRTTI